MTTLKAEINEVETRKWKPMKIKAGALKKINTLDKTHCVNQRTMRQKTNYRYQEWKRGITTYPTCVIFIALLGISLYKSMSSAETVLLLLFWFGFLLLLFYLVALARTSGLCGIEARMDTFVLFLILEETFSASHMKYDVP